MALYGVDLHSQGKNVVLQMRLKVKRMGPLGIRRIEYHFQQFDPELTGSLQLSEAHEALNASGLFPSVPDLQAVYKNFQDDEGFFKYVNFIHALRPSLSVRQEKAILDAFKTFGADPVPLSDIGAAYSPEASALYLSGAQTAEEAKDEYVTMLKTHAGVDGEGAVIDLLAWCKFYTDLSMCVPNEDYLVQNLAASFGIEEVGRKPSIQEVNLAILQLKSALIQSTTGVKDEVKLRRFIRTWNPAGRVDASNLFELMLDVGMDATPAIAAAILDRVDLEKAGAVDLESLVAIICGEDPRWGSG
jgi:Ca2+-binding EF-hand superfamily protein